jgi:ATP-dependent DNA helicase RecG
LTPQEQAIIQHIDQRGSIATPEVDTLLAIKQRRARGILREMADKGWLEKRGNARSTVYERART